MDNDNNSYNKKQATVNVPQVGQGILIRTSLKNYIIY